MDDYDLIKETLFDYFEGYMTKDRKRLESAFCLGIANMASYWVNEDGVRELVSNPIEVEIDDWVSPEHDTYGNGVGRIINLHIFSEDGASVTFDCGGRFIDTFQLVKIDGAWKIVGKLFVDQ